MLSQNPFDQFDDTQSDPGFTGVIPGVPKPKDPQPKAVSGGYIVDPNSGTASPISGLPRPHVLSPEEANASHLDPAASWQVDATGNYKKLGDAPAAGTPEEKTQAAMDSTRNLMQSIEKARGLVSNWSTGLGGAVGKLYPGSDQAKQLDSIVHQELRGNIFQNWVAHLKAESATGTSGIGRIMQSEIPLVTGALGALDPVAMGRDQTLNSFDQIENRVLRSAALLNHENPDDPKVLHKYREQFLAGTPVSNNNQTPPGPDNNGGSNNDGPPPPTVPDLPPEQQAKDKAFLATNPTPEQYTSFLTALTGRPVDAKQAAERLKAAQAGGAYSGAVVEAGPVTKALNDLGQTPFVQSFNDIAGGVIKGAAALPDMAAKTVGSVLAAPVDWAGYHDAANALRNPVQFGKLVDEQIPLSNNAMAGINRFGGELLGGVVGFPQKAANAVAEFVAGRGSREAGRVPNAIQQITQGGSGVEAAAKAEGVDPIRPMVDPSSTARFNSLRGKSFSGPIIDAGVNKTTDQIAGRVSALGNGGTALEPQAMGDAVRGTGLRYITQTGQQFNRLYGQIRQGIGDTKIPSENLSQQLDGLISHLSETPNTNAKEIAWLKDLKEDYGKDMSVDALRGLRTKIRQQLSKGDLTFGPDEARVSSLADAAALDIGKGLQKAGKGDLAAKFGEVDAAYRERMVFIGDTIQKLVGKRGQNLSGEQVFQNLKAMSGPRGSASGISRMREQMTPEEAKDLAATFAEALGKDAKGDFSLTDLVKQTDPRKMPSAMRNALFGPDGAQSLENLRLLSKKLSDATAPTSAFRAPWREAARAFVSNITRFGPLAVGGGIGAETGSIGAGVGAGAAAAGIAGLGAARRVLSARAMVNPRVSRWLSQAADVSTPSQAKQAVMGLSLVISREPAIANELIPIRDFLNQRVTQPLAAEPSNTQDGNNEQR